MSNEITQATIEEEKAYYDLMIANDIAYTQHLMRIIKTAQAELWERMKEREVLMYASE